MKTVEQIAGSHSLSSCARCDCALGNGGVCKRLVALLNEAMALERRTILMEQIASVDAALVLHGHAIPAP